MESAIVSIVSIALILIASVTMMMSSLTSINSAMDSWMKMEKEADAIRRTEISTEASDYTGGMVELWVSNTGETNIGSFDDWDIITRYETGEVNYVDYTDNATPDSNHWTVEGLYLTDNISSAEKFDPDILNPGETARVLINMDPEIQAGDYSLVITSTSKGVTSQCMVPRE